MSIKGWRLFMEQRVSAVQIGRQIIILLHFLSDPIIQVSGLNV